MLRAREASVTTWRGLAQNPVKVFLPHVAVSSLARSRFASGGATGGHFFSLSAAGTWPMEFWQIPPSPTPHHLRAPLLGTCLLQHAGSWTWSFCPRASELQCCSSQRAAPGVSGGTDISGLDAGWATGTQALESLLDSWESARIGGKDRGCPSMEATSHHSLRRLRSWEWGQDSSW